MEKRLLSETLKIAHRGLMQRLSHRHLSPIYNSLRRQQQCAYALGREIHDISETYGFEDLTSVLHQIKIPTTLVNGDAIDSFVKGVVGHTLETKGGHNFCKEYCKVPVCQHKKISV